MCLINNNLVPSASHFGPHMLITVYTLSGLCLECPYVVFPTVLDATTGLLLLAIQFKKGSKYPSLPLFFIQPIHES